MKTIDFTKNRMPDWRRLEVLCGDLESSARRKLNYRQRLEFANLYRSACADLALADAHQIPQRTVRYLHQLVGRAHNQLYRSKRFETERWAEEMFRRVPRRLFRDGYLRFAFVLFWGGFLVSIFLASKYSPVTDYAATLVGEDQLATYERMYADDFGGPEDHWHMEMVGVYIFHNTGIGIRCFAMGLLLGIGGLFETAFNALYLGAVFGYMTQTSDVTRDHFFEFVTAHGPFELNAIVLSAAAGMRLGFSLVSTGGLTRTAALAKAGRETLPTMGAAIALFFGAAMIEGLVSPTSAPYELKAFIAGLSTLLLLVYFVVLGVSPEVEDEMQHEATPTSPFDESPATLR